MALTEKLVSIADAVRGISGKTEKLTLDQICAEITGLQTLNFSVVGNPRPEAAGENTIWVDTDEPITGWVFSPAEPDPAAGMMWFQTGVSGSVVFNALKVNDITLYLLSAKQYIEGAWVQKEAMIYRGGWVEWVRWLYNEGVSFPDFTGILTTKLIKYSSSVTGTKATTVTENADNVHILQTGSTTVPVGCVTCFEKKIDLSGYRTLHFSGILNDTAGGNPQRCFLGIWKEFGTYRDTNRAAYLAADNQDCEKTLDISGLDDGEYYIGFYTLSPDIYKQSYVTMRKMWLE